MWPCQLTQPRGRGFSTFLLKDATVRSVSHLRKAFVDIQLGRRRRERQAALESLVGLSRSIEEANSTAVQQGTPQISSDGSPSSDSADSNAISNADSHISNISSNTEQSTANTSDTSLTPTLINWPLAGEPSWPAQSLGDGDVMPDLLADASWNTNNDFTQLNDFLQADDIQNATFADDWHITVPELDLLRAAYDNASRINSSHLLFAGLTAQSVFQTSDCSSWILTLPDNLMPTVAQLSVPHHPAIDILPWPAVRNRLIKMYNMPSDFWPRHPSDGTESSLVRFIYDMEDDGVRVTGADPAKESAWEIDQRFFENWWWALDQAIVANTNLKRLARGQKMLCAPSPGS